MDPQKVGGNRFDHLEIKVLKCFLWTSHPPFQVGWRMAVGSLLNPVARKTQMDWRNVGKFNKHKYINSNSAKPLAILISL